MKIREDYLFSTMVFQLVSYGHQQVENLPQITSIFLVFLVKLLVQVATLSGLSQILQFSDALRKWLIT